MKKSPGLVALVVAAAVCAAGSLAAEPFSQRLTPEEFKAAGLAKLSPEEIAQLDALFGKYRDAAETAKVAPASAPAPARLAAAESAQTRQTEIDAAVAVQAAARVAEAEARARKAEQEAAAAREAAATAKAEQKKAEEGFLAKAKKVFVSPSTKVEVATLETEIDGNFDGWDELTTWRMADGSLWRVDNKPPPYQVKRVSHPKVRIYSAALAGFWMEFVDLDLKVRVRQVK